MSPESGGTPRRVRVEAALVLFLFVAAACLGTLLLRTHRGADGRSAIACPTTFFARPLMVAAGRGSFQPDVYAMPELQRFLERQTAAFDPATLPERIPDTYDSAAEYHVYLEWVVTRIWCVFGISWHVLEPFLGILLGLCAACAYGIFRLGMNRTLSAAGTALFVTSPAVLDQVSNMRDFSKAPFLLAGIYFIGWLVTRRGRASWIHARAAAMGVIAGLGMGFRQDALILVPASLAAILLGAPGAVFGTAPRRLTAAAVYFAAFLAAAFPMLTRMEGGAQPYHPIAQGYSMKHMDRCALEPGPCEPLACSHDNFVFATMFSYARRVTGNERLYFNYNDPEDARYTRDWLLRTGMQFPADTLARGYGATLNLLAGADSGGALLDYHDGISVRLADLHRPIAAFLRVAGPLLALGALLAAAAGGLRPGAALLLMVLYFCGYVSLDNEWRHTFHMAFLSFWVAGFVIQQAARALRLSLGGTACWRLWLRRSACFAVLAALLLCAPWLAARVWQRHALETLCRQYTSAPRKPVSTRAESMQDWTLNRIPHSRAGLPLFSRLRSNAALRDLMRAVGAPGHWETRCGLYAVRFKARPSGYLFMAKYRGEDITCAFSQLMRVAGSPRQDTETVFYFPVYEMGDRAVFEGIALPQEDASCFLGLSRVEDHALPLLLPCAAVHAAEPSPPPVSRIRQPYDPMRLCTPENDWVSMFEASQKAEKLGRTGEMVFYARAALALNPTEEQRVRMPALYELAGDKARALEALKDLVAAKADNIQECGLLGRFLEKNPAVASPAEVWEELSRRTSSPNVLLALEKYVDVNDTAKRMDLFRRILQSNPGDINTATKLQQLLDAKADALEAAGNLDEALAVCEEAVPLNPNSNEPVLRIDRYLAERPPAERKAAWDRIWEKNPENAHAAASCGAARVVAGDVDGARAAFATAHRLSPAEWRFFVVAGDAYASASVWPDAVSAYEKALALNPSLDYLRGRLEEAQKRIADSAAPAGPGS